jgi:adenosine deaminase
MSGRGAFTERSAFRHDALCARFTRRVDVGRLGTGIHFFDPSLPWNSPALVAYLAQERIALEVCLTSNVRLGIYRDYAAHPLARLHAAGVPVTVNSDDPSLFGTTLTREIELLAPQFGFDPATIDEIVRNGFRHSFLPAEQKNGL